MSHKGWSSICLCWLFVCLSLPSRVFAKNFEIQVHGSETVAPFRTMLELHTNMALRGTTHTVDEVLRTRHALHETIEVTEGFTPWLETGVYIFTSWRSGDSWQWVEDPIRPRVRVPES